MAQLAAIERAPELEPLQVATDNNFAPTPMEGLFSSVLPSLASALAGGTDDERVEALGQLAQVVDTSFGDDAVQVGGYLREHGVLKSLVWLLEHSDAIRWILLPRAFAGLVALLCATAFIVGINQIYDVRIDEVCDLREGRTITLELSEAFVIAA